MRDDYLWDGSSEPDPEVQRLEHLLEQFRSQQPTPEMVLNKAELPLLSHRALWPRWVAVAAMLILVVGAWFFFRRLNPGWEVARLQGAPQVGSTRIRQNGRLRIGQWLETDSSSRAILSVGQIGQVEIEPNTRLRLLQARITEHRLALAHGTMHANIWAPPRLFFVDIPSAVATDLGCAYTLSVDDSGAGLLRVTHGWVAFDLHGRESFAPEGALCATRPGIGPGTPYFEESSKSFQQALAKLDFEPLTDVQRLEALAVVLTEARRRDGLTLWHLLSRVRDSERGRVYDRTAELIPPPVGVTREGVMQLDKSMLDLWWNQLGLRDTTWWRFWKGPWTGQTK